MKILIFFTIALIFAIASAAKQENRKFLIKNGSLISRSKLINSLGPNSNDTVTIQVTKDETNPDKLIGFVPVKNSNGDTYLIPKEAIQHIQKQYDAAGNADGAILVPESIIEIDSKDLENEGESNLIIRNKDIGKLDADDVIALIENPELLGRQNGRPVRRRQNVRRGGGAGGNGNGMRRRQFVRGGQNGNGVRVVGNRRGGVNANNVRVLRNGGRRGGNRRNNNNNNSVRIVGNGGRRGVNRRNNNNVRVGGNGGRRGGNRRNNNNVRRRNNGGGNGGRRGNGVNQDLGISRGRIQLFQQPGGALVRECTGCTGNRLVNFLSSNK